MRVSNDRYQRTSIKFEQGDEDFNLSVSPLLKADNNIFLFEWYPGHMNGIGSMHEDGGGTVRIQAGYEFCPDDSTLPDPGNDHPSLRMKISSNTFYEVIIDTIDQGGNRSLLHYRSLQAIAFIDFLPSIFVFFKILFNFAFYSIFCISSYFL